MSLASFIAGLGTAGLGTAGLGTAGLGTAGSGYPPSCYCWLDLSLSLSHTKVALASVREC
jgi:hypothetical protein